MPASLGLQCPHLHCTRVHNKRPQTPISPCARAQCKTRASKKMPASTRAQKDARVATSYARGRIRASASLRASKGYPHRPRHTRDRLLRASKRCQRWPRHPHVGLPSHRPKMAVSTSTRAKMHTSPATLAPKMAASMAVTEFETWSCRLHLSSHVLPTIRSDVRRGFGYK